MRRERSIELIDTQSGGDVSRIVTSGIRALPGASVLEQARWLQREGDGLRRLLLSEPYGDPAMSVDLIVEPGHPEAEAGYIIMEAMGYPMYSGSNTLCVATALLESGIIEMTGGEQRIVLESPAGLGPHHRDHDRRAGRDGHHPGRTRLCRRARPLGRGARLRASGLRPGQRRHLGTARR